MYEYNVSLPTSQAATYGPNDTITFKIGYKPGKSIVKNSLRLNGFLEVKNGANFVAVADNCNFSSIGSHALIQYLSVSMGQIGIIESNPEYPQMYNAYRLCNNSPDNIMSDSRYVAELQSCDVQISKAIAQYNDDGDKPFSIKPMCCLNRTSGNIPFDKIRGDITVTLRLSDVNTLLFNDNGATTAFSYTIGGSGLTDASGNVLVLPRNAAQTFRLSYLTTDTSEVEMKQPLTYEYFTYNKVVMSSDNFQLSTINPGVCKSMCITACPNANFSAVDKDKTCSLILPGLSRVEFMINNSVGKVINFPLDDLSEIERNFWLSLSDSRDKSYISFPVNADQTNVDGFTGGIGLNFGELINMNSQTFNVNIQSTLNNTPFQLFAFFKNVAEI